MATRSNRLIVVVYTPRGGENGPVTVAAFKAADSALCGSNGGFDSHTPPPYLYDMAGSYKKSRQQKAAIRDFGCGSFANSSGGTDGGRIPFSRRAATAYVHALGLDHLLYGDRAPSFGNCLKLRGTDGYQTALWIIIGP
jgi:hypothetical protein